MENFFNSIADFFQSSPVLTSQILKTLVVIFILWLIRSLTLRVVHKNVESKRTTYKWRKNLTYISAFIGIILISQIWFSALGDLSTYFGLLSAGLAIALKDPVTDLAAWLFIIWRKPFDVGDRIELGKSKGDVIDIRPFKFTILEIGNWVDADQSTGRVIHIPNHTVFTEQLANYTSDFQFIWNEIGIMVTFESDWKKAKEILSTIAEEESKDFIEQAKEQIKRAAKSYLIEYRYLTPIVYTNVKDSGVMLSIRYLTDPRRRRGSAQAIWERALDEFSQSDSIDLAYPTIRVFNNPKEGKPDTGGPTE
ncbi:mechanosensitive ion channel protein MscS [Balneola sp. EhC07]|uniref:mechanosensitive ion channel family protein n=1 Tax=Balneola sp. EhC07 TaxID=1849360 RepID=UPI0007F4A010|nr:mechanosensitive ion channel domain-containing protein [Balneola sp. EhC07]OAN61467.1 mechanosensitive ion channel protein MscS [Balneola sp. EhC07]